MWQPCFISVPHARHPSQDFSAVINQSFTTVRWSEHFWFHGEAQDTEAPARAAPGQDGRAGV